jgi:ferredoxin
MKQSFLGRLYDKRQSRIDIRTYVEPGVARVHPGEFSRAGMSVPEIVMEYGSSGGRFRDMAPVLPVLLRTVRKVIKSYRNLKENPADTNRQATDKFIASLVDYAKDLGCLNVGFARLEPWMVFRDRMVLFPNAIVLTMEMRHEPIARAPSATTEKGIFRTYHELGDIVNKLATMLRENGYQAQAGPALGGDAIYPILAERAGLGVVGANGLLISPAVGPSQRIATVYTNIENLPFATANPYEWIRDYCKSCGLCIAACPGDAIFKQPRIDSEVGRTYIDYKKCAVPFANNHGCTVCVKECVFFATEYDAISRRYEESRKGAGRRGAPG